MSRLIKIYPSIHTDPKPEGHEFGQYVFDPLPHISTVPKEEVVVNMVDNTILTQDTNLDIDISKVEVQRLQESDVFVNTYLIC